MGNVSSFTEELQRIAALPFNEYFKDDVKNIRIVHGVPSSDGSYSYRWLNEYIKPYGKMIWVHFHKYRHPSLRYLNDRAAKTFDETDVPLEQDVLGMV